MPVVNLRRCWCHGAWEWRNAKKDTEKRFQMYRLAFSAVLFTQKHCINLGGVKTFTFIQITKILSTTQKTVRCWRCKIRHGVTQLLLSFHRWPGTTPGPRTRNLYSSNYIPPNAISPGLPTLNCSEALIGRLLTSDWIGRKQVISI